MEYKRGVGGNPPHKMKCDKPDTGSVLSHAMTGNHVSPSLPHGLLDSPRSENLGTDTGSVWSPSSPRKQSVRSSDASIYRGSTLKPPAPLLPRLTAIKKKQEMENPLNSVSSPLLGIPLPIGPALRSWQKQVKSIWSRRTFTFVITGLSSQLQPIMTNLSQWREQQKFIMAQLVPGNLVEPFPKRDPMCMLKILVANSGVATAVTAMLLSMNFEEESMYPTCSDGWIDIQSEWNSRDPLHL